MLFVNKRKKRWSIKKIQDKPQFFLGKECNKKGGLEMERIESIELRVSEAETKNVGRGIAQMDPKDIQEKGRPF